MKALIPALFLALAGSAEAATVCQAVSENAHPIQQVSLAWGESLPDSNESPFFRNRKQKVSVTISGLRYHHTYEAVAHHTSHSTRLGEQRSTSIQLSETDRIYLTEYPEHFGHSRLKAAGLVLGEGTPEAKTIQLDCP